MFEVYAHVIEGCAGVAAFACWGVSAVIARQLVASDSVDRMVDRFRFAARWVARAAIATAILSLADASAMLYAVVTR